MNCQHQEDDKELKHLVKLPAVSLRRMRNLIVY